MMTATPILSMYGQAALFIEAALIGLLAGLFYDALRVLRVYIKHSSLAVHAEDILYWLAVLIFLFYIFLNRHYETLRGFTFLGLGLGMLLYFAALSRFIRAAARKIIDFILKVLRKIIWVLLAPLRMFVRKLQKPAMFLFELAKKLLQNAVNYAKIKVTSFKRDVKTIFTKI